MKISRIVNFKISKKDYALFIYSKLPIKIQKNMFLTGSGTAALAVLVITVIVALVGAIGSIISVLLTILLLFFVGIPLILSIIALVISLINKKKPSPKTLAMKFNKKQIILISVIIATIAGFTLAYIKGEPCSDLSRAFKGAISAVSGHHYSRCYYQFNYIAGIASFVTSGGLTFLILNKKYKKDTIENK